MNDIPAPDGSHASLLHVVAVALVDADGRVFLQQRPPEKPMAGLWEFLGGKVEAGETPEEALVRELKEELGIDTHISCLAPAAFASERLGDCHLLLLLYNCRKWSGMSMATEDIVSSVVKTVQMNALPMP